MSILFHKSWVCLLLVICPFLLYSQKPVSNFNLEIYKGDNTRDLQSILTDNNYVAITGTAPNLGVSDSWQYLKVKLNSQDLGASKILWVDNPTIDSIELYQLKPNLKKIGCFAANSAYSSSKRESYGFEFGIQADSLGKGEFVLRAKSGKQLLVPINIDSREEINKSSNINENLMLLYFGIIIVLVIYNFFLYIAVREKSYALYVFYLFSVGLTQACLYGFGNKFFWPHSSWLSTHAVYISGALSGIATIFFSMEFLKTKVLTPRLHKILIGYMFIDLFSILLCVLGYFNLSYNLINFAAASSLILLVCSIFSAKAGNRSANYFIIAWSIFLVGVTVFALKDFGILPYNKFTLYALPLGSALEGILLSFGLADKINQLKREKEEAQARELAALQIKKDELQKQVAEQTAEVVKQRDNAITNLNELRLTQRQLLESEKLSALGQMTAGIAHELNNPINFVSSNIAPLNRDVDEVLKFMTEFEQLPDNDPNGIAELKKRYHAADMPYVKQEIDMLMKGIHEGARRTADIVKGMRIFARADRDALVRANINECMEATLIVMKSALKEEVTLHRELDAHLPEVECFPGKLNQVFVNILGNAIHATRMEGRAREQRHIWVKSWANDDTIFISIRDNGKGMDEEVKSKIFDPFYTTKGVGEGTGLGLSITLGILEEHKGNVVVNSQPNEGTEFLIEIPRNLKQIRAMAA